MCPFPIPTLFRNKSQYELDAARRCPFNIAARIRVKNKEGEPLNGLRLSLDLASGGLGHDPRIYTRLRTDRDIQKQNAFLGDDLTRDQFRQPMGALL
jgi:hypothetical protein